MGLFILRRLGVMLLTALCLTFIVFFMTNLYPNLEKLAKTQGNFRMSEEQVETWLSARGYTDNMFVKYCLLYTSPSPRDLSTSRMPSSA